MGRAVMRCGTVAGLLLMGLLFCPLARANSFESIRLAAGKITTIQADFVQEKHMAILARPLTATGRFIFKAPGSLRWEYVKPVKSLLLMYNGEAHRYSETDKGLTEDTAAVQYMDFVLEEISKWLNGRFNETAMFTASLASENRIVLTPKEEGTSQFIKRIEMVMADQPGVMKEVSIFESEDSYTRFTFVEPRINEPLSDDVFQAAK